MNWKLIVYHAVDSNFNVTYYCFLGWKIQNILWAKRKHNYKHVLQGKGYKAGLSKCYIKCDIVISFWSYIMRQWGKAIHVIITRLVLDILCDLTIVWYKCDTLVSSGLGIMICTM